MLHSHSPNLALSRFIHQFKLSARYLVSVSAYVLGPYIARPCRNGQQCSYPGSRYKRGLRWICALGQEESLIPLSTSISSSIDWLCRGRYRIRWIGGGPSHVDKGASTTVDGAIWDLAADNWCNLNLRTYWSYMLYVWKREAVEWHAAGSAPAGHTSGHCRVGEMDLEWLVFGSYQDGKWKGTKEIWML